MEGTNLEWRALARRQWPLASVLVMFLLLQAQGDGPAWSNLIGSLSLAALAVVSPRKPFDAALAAATALVASSVLMRATGATPGPSLLGALTIVELGAMMAMAAIVVRQEKVWRSTVALVVLVAAGVAEYYIRPNYWVRYPDHFPAEPSLLPNAVVTLILLALAVGTGLYFRARDRERATAVRAEVAAAQHAERMALARELHDVVAHYVTGIVVHAQAAQAVPQAAQEVLPIIVTSGNEALTAMRRLVGTLRDSEAAAPEATDSGLADDVRAVAEKSGQPVRLSVDLPGEFPVALARSVLRLVQESLTNTRKHADGVTRVDVEVTSDGSAVRVLVADDGRQRTSPLTGSSGYGLVGMRERAELLGGSFTAGPRPTGGWEVRAEIPVSND
ncbi:sensor histidine kinase [Actinosynnema pretiosum]|uniref:histidine kinase n=1 Tax=Actinosynnema pretiosum TaxID=42197 RepID=A0A290ZFS1_9PSEU|nr:histidine kinase [Actinosynnema pretiosum]ATE57823.1 histidine kinase [Actinosynnema pretiosum]